MNTKTTKSKTDHDHLLTVAHAAVDTGIANGVFKASKRDLLMASCESNAVLCEWVTAAAIKSVAAAAPVSPSDEALLAASRARMGGGNLAARADAVRTASLADALIGENVPQIPDALGPTTVAPPQESSSAPPVVGPLGVAVDAGGGMSYRGLPVSMGADGLPRVHVTAGAMTIDMLHSLGVDLEYERLLYASRRQMGAAA